MSEASHAIHSEKQGDVTIAQFRVSSVTEAQYLDQAFEDIKGLAGDPHGKVIFSLGNVDAIASRALASLVWLNRELRSRKGQLIICDVQPMVAHVLQLTRLDTMLRLTDTRDEALAAFGEVE